MESMQPGRNHHSTRLAANQRRAKHHLSQLGQRGLRQALVRHSLAALTLLVGTSYGWSQPRRAFSVSSLEHVNPPHLLSPGPVAHRVPGRTIYDNPQARKDLFIGKCTAVVDGDTIVVEHDGQIDKVDLWGVDCPELGQPYGQQARQFTTNRVLGQTVRVRVKGHHKGRILGFVDSGPGSTLNEELVGGGLGWFYPKQASDTFLIPLLQDTARQDKRGLWADKDPMAPWQWRKLH